jgi:putative DNA primase/helicase
MKSNLTADEGETFPVRTELLSAATADPAAVADYILSQQSFDGIPMLRYWGGTWWLWADGKFSELENNSVRALVTRAFAGQWSAVRSRHVSDVIEHLRAGVILSPGTSPPAWIGDPPNDWKLADCLTTRDSIVNLPAFVGGIEPFAVPATPNLFNTVATEFDFLSDAPEPVEWFKFLNEVWPDDQGSTDCLQEIFGYALTADTSQQKLFVIIGPKRGGKGTIARVLERLVGPDNVAGPTLAGLSGDFGLQQILGKSLAIVSDLRLGPNSNRSVIVERLLAITGEDKLTVDRKNKTAVHCRLPTRFLILSNELPRLDDASATIISRMIVLRVTETFFGREDPELLDRLIPELPGIFIWAIEGWRRLNERGRFEQPESAQELVDELETLASPMTAFINDRCLVDPQASVERQELFEEWANWCGLNGFKPGTTNRFGQSLRSVVPGLSDQRPRDTESGVRRRYYGGIALRP